MKEEIYWKAGCSMKLINRNTGEVILNEVALADTFIKRFMGLMGKKELRSGTGLKIDPCNSIHTFNMRFPIDVVFLSKDHEVMKVVHGMKPGKVGSVVKKARYVIEANSNEFSSKVKIGDYLELG